jgi:hypothetical protein
MKLKSSNKSSVLFLASIIGLTLVLFFLSSGKKKKEPKYLAPPPYEKKTNLDAIQLTFNEKAFQKLEKKRFKALAKGILETNDADYVPAVVTFKGVNYKSEVRLKGDWTDHLKGEKWSFRVKLKGDKTILGMRKFSIHHPQTRGFYYTAEWLYLKAIKREHLMGLRYAYLEGAIHVKMKNDSTCLTREVGLYALEEAFDKRTIESNNAKESVILKFSENNFWNEVGKSIEVGSSLGYKWSDFMNYGLVSKTKYEIMPFSEVKIVRDTTMFKYFKLGRNLLEDVYLGKRPIDEAFDVKKLAMQNAILNLFGAAHGTYLINLRFYYNPITSKLEPIAFDGNSGLKLKKYEHFLFLNKVKDSVYLKELAYALDKVRSPEYLEDLLEEYKEEMAVFEKPLKKEFHSRGLSKINLAYNQEFLKNELIILKNRYNLEDINIELESVRDIETPKVPLWINNRIILNKTVKNRNKKAVYSMTRKNTSSSSYSVINNINVNYGRQYKVSINLKKGDMGAFFGLRLQGDYPNRVDAVFNLEKGKVEGFSAGGGFEKANAAIKPIGNGWYNCSLSGRIMDYNIKTILGPTTGDKKVSSWEGATNINCDAYILPSSLKIEEVLY